LQLTQTGTVKVFNGETEIAEVPVGDLAGKGNLTGCTFTYNPSSETVTIYGSNNTVLGEIPLPEGLNGKGELNNCTFIYDPTDEMIHIIKTDGSPLLSIPLPENLKGTGIISNCTLTYNPTEDTYTINGGNELPSFIIKSS